MSFIYDTKKSLVENKNAFVNYVYNNHCKCQESCLQKADFKLIKKNTSKCNLIMPALEYSEDYIKSIENILTLFKNLGIFFIKNNKYYLNASRRFNWNNIKELEKNDTNCAILEINEIKELIWLFRKAIVDCIIKYSLMFVKDPIQVFSVGSVKLSSDYDITIYGTSEDTIYIIKQFNQIFQKIFLFNSQCIFDTNLYGTSFIKFKNDVGFIKGSCNDTTFYYMKNNNEIQDSQLVWSLVHLYKSLFNVFDSKTITVIWKSEFLHIPLELLKASKTIYDFFINQDLNYIKVLEQPHLLAQSLKLSSIVEQTNYISISNFYGSETYFSHGAFMNIVVKNQMCKGETSSFQLDDIQYIQSFIENGAFFIEHYNIKYLDRMNNPLILSEQSGILANIREKSLIEPDTTNILEYSNQKYSNVLKILEIASSLIKNMGKTEFKLPIIDLINNGDLVCGGKNLPFNSNLL